MKTAPEINESSPPARSDRQISPDRFRHIIRTLVFGSAVCAGLLFVRFACARDNIFRFSGFLFNLLLAWIPLILALVLRRISTPRNRRWFWGSLIAWMLFFPNAFYITTDLIHVRKFGTDGIFRWYDLLMTTSFACAGMFLGCLALYLLHLSVRRRFGWKAGWGFAATMLALGAFGIYLGRFLRLNSWDVITRPFKLTGDISALMGPTNRTEVAAFSVTFFFFSLAVYSFVVSMARLHEVPATGESEQR